MAAYTGVLYVLWSWLSWVSTLSQISSYLLLFHYFSAYVCDLGFHLVDEWSPHCICEPLGGVSPTIYRQWTVWVGFLYTSEVIFSPSHLHITFSMVKLPSVSCPSKVKAIFLFWPLMCSNKHCTKCFFCIVLVWTQEMCGGLGAVARAMISTWNVWQHHRPEHLFVACSWDLYSLGMRIL